DLARMRSNRNHDRMLIRLRRFEGRELAVEQGRWHEMPVARRQPTRDQIPPAFEIDDADVGALADQDIAIGAFERRACDGAMVAGAPSRVDPGGDALQPGPAILVGERLPGVHLLDVGLRVEPVALLEDPIQPVGEHRRDRALAAPGYAHHHDDGSLPRRRTGVFVGFSALSLAQARGWGAPTTRHSPRCPLLMALGHERSTYRWPLLPSAGGSILRVPGHAEAMGTAAPHKCARF